MPKNRNPVKQLFITFPHSTVDKCTFRDDLVKLFSIDYYKICEEKHKDGTPHLHAILRCAGKGYSETHMIKIFKEYYPNDWKRIHVKPVRSIKHSMVYTSKEDENPLESAPFEENRNPKKALLTKYARFFGYSSIEALQKDVQEQEEFISKVKCLVLEKHMYWLNHPDYENQIPYEISKTFNNLFDEKHVSKDDMTKLIKFYKIKL